jgi:alpha-ketoglutarate-dependent 2,4-dichlorophenoxyacetate dioxygenase
MDVRPLSPDFGAEITGVDVAGPLSDAGVQAITAASRRYAVIVFRGQKLDDDSQLAFAKRFGEVELVISSHRARRLSRPELVDVSNLDEHGRVRVGNDRLRMLNLGNRLWHTDSSFKRVRGALSMLYAHAVPPQGGDTEFADLRAAYDALPQDMKSELEDLIAEHSVIHSRTQMGFTDFTPEEQIEFAPVQHPVVGTLPWSGRKTLYLASHASYILGRAVPESRLLLQELIEHGTQRAFVMTHTWKVGDLVIWDNRCTMHRGRTFDESHPRDLRRVTTADLPA